ncbi:MAG: radical SAM family heme chaperone HemW [Cyclobacteriaceae bacterium]|nr:radical SAM family heme chaperone HemW [Cyclobacteriaceae bacterium]
MAGIYIHIPFCKQACHYCDFHFSTNTQRIDEMASALIREIDLQRHYLSDKKIETIYFGGGTPSMLSAGHLESLLHKIDQLHTVSADTEITLEANPDDLSLAKLIDFKKIGINRLSIGVQTFDDGILKFLNRSHDSQAATNAIENAQRTGFDNISIDLIFAIPDQSQKALTRDLELLKKISPNHISTYSLTIAEKTAFGNWLSKGKMKPASEAENARQFELIMGNLTSFGYEHYEISNFAKPKKYSRHNTSYWKQLPYLGIGPSAHSYNLNTRQHNVSNNALYLREIGNGNVPAEVETLTKENKINEFVFTSLRTMWGCDLNKLQNLYDHNFEGTHTTYLHQIVGQGLVELSDNKILRLTNKGKLVADQIAMEFMI